MIPRHSIFAISIAILATQPLRSADAQMPPHVEEEIIQLEPEHTHVDFTLRGKLHVTNGHFALKRGTIRVDPGTGNAAGEIAIDAASESSSVDLRDAITKNAVLEVERYPEIVFYPKTIQGVRGSQDDFYGEVAGLMQLRGGLHELTVPFHGRLSGDQISAACEFLIPYADWGLDSPNLLSASQIIHSAQSSRSRFATSIFAVFAYLLPLLRKIPSNLLWVSDLVDVKVETQGRIIWAPEPEARTITVIVPRAAQVKSHPGL